jgi:hypothetical protein
MFSLQSDVALLSGACIASLAAARTES